MSVLEQIASKAANLSAEEQQRVLLYLEWLQTIRPIPNEEQVWGEVGAKLAAETLEPEDFSDWERGQT